MDVLQRVERLTLVRNVVLALAVILLSCAAGTLGLAAVNPKHTLSGWAQLAAGGHLYGWLLPLLFAGLILLALAAALHGYKLRLLARLSADPSLE